MKRITSALVICSVSGSGGEKIMIVIESFLIRKNFNLVLKDILRVELLKGNFETNILRVISDSWKAPTSSNGQSDLGIRPCPAVWRDALFMKTISHETCKNSAREDMLFLFLS